MSPTPDPRKPSEKDQPAAAPKPRPGGADVDAYELEESGDAGKRAEKKPSVGRSYLTDESGAPKLSAEEQRLLGAKKMLGMGQPGKAMGEVKAVDAMAAARKRDEDRRKGAEEWAAAEAAQRKRRIIVGLVVVTVLVCAFFYVRSQWGFPSVWEVLGLEPPDRGR